MMVTIDRVRRARWSTAVIFLLTGLVFATWAARVPALKADLGLSDGQLALAFMALNAGAVPGLQLGAVVVARIGSRVALMAALPAFAGLLVALAFAVNLATLAAALAVSALANSVVDVAMNEQGVGIERQYERPLLSGLHAMHPLGGIIGGGIAALAAHAEVPLVAHFGMVALVALLAARQLLPPRTLRSERAGDARPSLLGQWTTRLVLLGALAFVFTLAEGAALDWSAVLLRDSLDASAAVAAAAVTVFLAAVTVGRLLGNRLVDRFGPVHVFRAGALLAGSGLAAGLLIGTPATALTGLALLGFGVATLLPLSISAAGAAGGVPVAVAVARVSMLGYLGSFTGPALIGLLATTVGLASAMLLPAIAVAATALAARQVRTTPADR